jgi:UDP-N-acetylmuramate dehydrogenase
MVGERVALSAYTTLGLGGPAGRFVAAGDDEQVITAVRQADRAGEPVLILGGGSNLVVADEGFPGTVIQVASRGIVVADAPPDAEGTDSADGESVLVTVAAGEPWDRLVAWSVAEGLAGLECLSGIPGLAGATPIQNVGAYGQDVSETITEVRALDRERDEVIRLSRADCKFGYRTSMLKRAAAGLATGRFVVLSVTFRLWRAEAEPDVAGQAAGRGAGLSRPLKYAELARTLGVEVGGQVPLEEARSAVLALRRGKGMVLEADDPDTRSAGSFFTNPIVSATQFEELRRRAAERLGPHTPVPHFPADEAPPDGGPAEGAVKVPAAWLIERAGFTKGYPADGPVRISTKHTLALTNPAAGSTADLLALAREIRAGVRAMFGINLANEPVLVGLTL